MNINIGGSQKKWMEPYHSTLNGWVISDIWYFKDTHYQLLIIYLQSRVVVNSVESRHLGL